MKKNILILLIMLIMPALGCNAFFDKKKDDVSVQQALSSYPEKYTPEYLKDLSKIYGSISRDQNIQVALDMMEGTTGEFSRKALMGYNLTERPIKVVFKDLKSINEKYDGFDALGWKKGRRLFIYINPRHSDAPPVALAALLSHEALHQDEFNSLAEETYAWTMEAAVWCELSELYPDGIDVRHPLVTREETLKRLFKKGNYSNRYIKKTVFSNKGYQDLPQTSPGFDEL